MLLLQVSCCFWHLTEWCISTIVCSQLAHTWLYGMVVGSWHLLYLARTGALFVHGVRIVTGIGGCILFLLFRCFGWFVNEMPSYDSIFCNAINFSSDWFHLCLLLGGYADNIDIIAWWKGKWKIVFLDIEKIVTKQQSSFTEHLSYQ